MTLQDPMQIGKDVNGVPTWGLVPSSIKYSATITVGAEQTVTLPLAAGALWDVVWSFEPGTRVWVAVNATAAVPVGATFATTTSELNPGTRTYNPGDVLHVITSDASVQMGFMAYQIGK